MQCKEKCQCSCERQMRLVSSQLLIIYYFTLYRSSRSELFLLEVPSKDNPLLRSVVLLYLSGNCSTVSCLYGATCKVIRGEAKCECDFTCSDSKSLVCGSDLKTYDNECKMKEAACNANKDISVLVRDKCG